MSRLSTAGNSILDATFGAPGKLMNGNAKDILPAAGRAARETALLPFTLTTDALKWGIRKTGYAVWNLLKNAPIPVPGRNR